MRRQIIDRYDGPTILGIDVSKWNDEDGDFDTMDLDFEAIAKDPQDIEFVVVRTGDGKDEDPLAVEYARAADAAGLRVAYYHYMRCVHDADIHLDVIERVVNTACVEPMFVAMDIEGYPRLRKRRTRPALDAEGAWWTEDGRGVSTERVVSVVEELGGMLECRGLCPYIYGGVAIHWHIAQRGFRLPKRWPLWAPYYTRGKFPRLPVGPKGEPAPWGQWTVWQFTAEGAVEGAERRVDMNRMRVSTQLGVGPCGFDLPPDFE